MMLQKDRRRQKRDRDLQFKSIRMEQKDFKREAVKTRNQFRHLERAS